MNDLDYFAQYDQSPPPPPPFDEDDHLDGRAMSRRAKTPVSYLDSASESGSESAYESESGSESGSESESEYESVSSCDESDTALDTAAAELVAVWSAADEVGLQTTVVEARRSVQEAAADIDAASLRVTAAQAAHARELVRINDAVQVEKANIRKSKMQIAAAGARVEAHGVRKKWHGKQRCHQCRKAHIGVDTCSPGAGGCARCDASGVRCVPWTAGVSRKSRTRKCEKCVWAKRALAVCRPGGDGFACGHCIDTGGVCRP